MGIYEHLLFLLIWGNPVPNPVIFMFLMGRLWVKTLKIIQKVITFEI